jgi:hypothetical protein
MRERRVFPKNKKARFWPRAARFSARSPFAGMNLIFAASGGAVITLLAS